MRFYPRLLIFSLILFVAFSCKTDKKQQKEISETSLSHPINVALRSAPDHLVPFLTRSGYSNQILKHIFMAPMSIDPLSNTLMPELAVKPLQLKTISREGNKEESVYEFRIKENATWQDGKAVTAYDYEFTLKCLFNPNIQTVYRPVYEFVENIIIDPNDTKKVSIVISQCEPLTYEALATLLMLPRHLFDPKGLMSPYSIKSLKNDKELSEVMGLKEIAEYLQRPMSEWKEFWGCNAYKLDEWSDLGVRIVKSEEWWGDKVNSKNLNFDAYPPAITYKIGADPVAVSAMMKNGELDVVSGLKSHQFKSYKNNVLLKDKFNFYMPPGNAYQYLLMNNEHKALSQREVRNALNYLFDKKKYRDQFLFKENEVIYNPIPLGSIFYNKKIDYAGFSVEKAKELLDANGWKDSDNDGILDKKLKGKKVSLEFTLKVNSSSVAGRQIMELFIIEARKAGIKIKLKTVDFNRKMLKSIRNGEFELFLGAKRFSGIEYNPKHDFLSSNIGRGGNASRYSNGEMDDIIHQLNSICGGDDTEKEKVYFKFQELLERDKPLLYLFGFNMGVAIHKSIKDPLISQTPPSFFENTYKKVKSLK